ncbi:hypothetical protein B0J13DRAFT_511141 [Dactylonectria estremocensis]|uniref:Uncharacterized protein n=1 Tax=Dactylonectria estremocensis TaxID=1079267 RepID=A0A9P9ILI9_9HYPO|nr:hypothetical protein B0J13DRAFT_511141 [Dactylonectria estremocensis]
MTARRLSDFAEGTSTKKVKISEDATDVTHDQWSAVETTCAEWCSIQQDGKVLLDDTRIKCFLPQSQREDSALMREVVQGRILSAKVYPLIFQNAQRDALDTVKLRTLPYFMALAAGDADGGSQYQSLTPEQRKIVAVGVRDLYIAGSTDLLSEQQMSTLEKMLQTLDDGLETQQIGGMTVSFYPSRTFSIMKFIEDLDEKVGNDESTVYAQLMDTPKLFAVFVNPADLSYHNFENIVPLDTWLESTLLKQHAPELEVSITESMQVQRDREVFTCKLQGAAGAMLKDLSSLDLYVPPLNNGTRGGERFIFHSALLSKALTGALKSSDVLEKLAGGRLSSSFVFVNYVFRSNRFDPKDSNFDSHLDTPYYDSAWSHVSKYTLLIYLTEGRSDPVLRVKDVSLDEVGEMTCVIFDQRYEHEGRPFLDGRKTFIRTELVFKDYELGHNDKVAALFSEACYMTGQSVLDKGLVSYAHECFERANSLHWAVEQAATQKPVYLSKQFQGIRFLTNGYNYWFPRGRGIDAKDCALVAVLDYFNCKVSTQPFRSLVSSTKIQERLTSEDDIWSFLSSHTAQTSRGFRRLKKSDLESLIKKSSDKPFVGQFDDWDGEPEELEDFDEDGDGCCPMHSFPIFNPWKSKEVMEAYELCCSYTRKKLFGAPLLLFNQEIVINEASIEIVGDKIFILREQDGKLLPPVNFAACWGDGPTPPEFVVVGDEIPAPDLVVPPITIHEYPQSYKLGLDFFRNDWILKVDDDYSIPVPDLSERPEEETSFASRIPELAEAMGYSSPD